MHRFTVAIAGGGASGTLAASALVRRSPAANVVIVDPSERLGRGVAYATTCPRHLLNVPAARMSALPGDPDHFVRWLAANVEAPYGPASFVPRAYYGAYLDDLATEARAAAPDRWRHDRALALDVREERDGLRVACSSGEEIRADALVVASGNAAPAAWPDVSPQTSGSRYFASAWQEGAIVPDAADETVLLLGTGLTAMDAVLGLRYHGHRGTIHLVSRRGLLPNEHRVFDVPPSTVTEAATVRELFDTMRTLAHDKTRSGEGWRRVIDDVRPRTNALWQALSLDEQRRFFRHALPYWNVHRHRVAPEAAEAFAELRTAGTLRVIAGRTGRIARHGDALRVPVAVRGGTEVVTVDAARVINCSGPQHDVRALANPLLRNLLARGTIAASPLGIGIRTADNGALVDDDGTPSTRAFAIGPVRFGTLIETTAIPEIRQQAHELADVLAATFESHGTQLAG